MFSKLKINCWDISGYVLVDFKTKKFILKSILQKFSINKFSRKLKVSGVSLAYFLKNKDSFIRIGNLLEIISKLKISRHSIEKNIIAYRDTSSKEAFSIKFPYFLSPIDVRIVGVLIGDGNINKCTNLMRWVQKDPTPLKNLIELRLGGNVCVDVKDTQIVIPAFFGKIVSHSLDLELKFLDSEEVIKRIMKFPKDYCLALLIALIEDEGNIDPKNYGGISIRMSSKDIIFEIKKLCEYLGYKTSQIVSYKNKGTFGNKNDKKTMYKINILSNGIKKLGYDLLNLEKKYCKEIGFWKKKSKFIERWKTCKSKNAEKDREGREIHDRIFKLFIENKNLSPLEVSKFLKTDYNRIYNLIKNMRKRGEIKRIRRGVYIKS